MAMTSELGLTEVSMQSRATPEREIENAAGQ